VRSKRFVLSESLESIGSGFNIEALVAKQFRERCASVHFIVDDKDTT
jgi:hypothetical protein